MWAFKGWKSHLFCTKTEPMISVALKSSWKRKLEHGPQPFLSISDKEVTGRQWEPAQSKYQFMAVTFPINPMF